MLSTANNEAALTQSLAGSLMGGADNRRQHLRHDPAKAGRNGSTSGFAEHFALAAALPSPFAARPVPIATAEPQPSQWRWGGGSLGATPLPARSAGGIAGPVLVRVKLRKP
jgi:hypothetical protein